jgi:hypothetical protein
VTPEQFIAKWQASTLKERSAAQSHFNDLCKVLGVGNPTDSRVGSRRGPGFE